MVNFKPIRCSSAELEKLPIIDGQFIITLDTKKIYIDYNTERLSIDGESNMIPISTGMKVGPGTTFTFTLDEDWFTQAKTLYPSVIGGTSLPSVRAPATSSNIAAIIPDFLSAYLYNGDTGETWILYIYNKNNIKFESYEGLVKTVYNGDTPDPLPAVITYTLPNDYPTITFSSIDNEDFWNKYITVDKTTLLT